MGPKLSGPTRGSKRDSAAAAIEALQANSKRASIGDIAPAEATATASAPRAIASAPTTTSAAAAAAAAASSTTTTPTAFVKLSFL